MTKWIDKELLERRVILQQAAAGEHLPEYAVEKDWWVSMTLKALFQTSCKYYLEFKGGTSLSKGWHLIDRFSEDIDVALNHRLFVPQLDNNTQLKNLRKKSRKFIEATLAEELGAQLNALGLSGYEVLPKIVDEAGNPIETLVWNGRNDFGNLPIFIDISFYLYCGIEKFCIFAASSFLS